MSNEMMTQHLVRLEAEIHRLRKMIPGEVLLTSTYKDMYGNRLNYEQPRGIKRWIIERMVKWMTGV